MTQYPLGRHVEHDPRSLNFPHKTRRIVSRERPRSVTHKMVPAALSQGDLGGCVGFTAAQWLNTQIAAKNRRRGTKNIRPTGVNKTSYLQDSDARTLYSLATELDGIEGQWPTDDTGSSGLGGAKALQQFNFIDSYTHVFDFPTLCNTVIFQPVMLGINWYETMFTPDANGLIHVAGDVAGGHEILVRGIDFTTGRFRLRNHWSPAWGIKGDCFISFDDMQRLMHEEGDVTVPTLIK